MGMTICKGCGEPILWIRTAGGKAMPCDPERITYWKNPQGTKKIVTPNGEVVSAETAGAPEQATGIGYVSHFATCPAAGSFRRGRKA